MSISRDDRRNMTPEEIGEMQQNGTIPTPTVKLTNDVLQKHDLDNIPKGRDRSETIDSDAWVTQKLGMDEDSDYVPKGKPPPLPNQYDNEVDVSISFDPNANDYEPPMNYQINDEEMSISLDYSPISDYDANVFVNQMVVQDEHLKMNPPELGHQKQQNVTYDFV